jgi:rhodanese-related sulfurtransferase
MKKKIIWLVIIGLMVLPLVIASCTTAATAQKATETQTVVVTETKTEPPKTIVVTETKTEAPKTELPLTFTQMVTEAMAAVPALTPAEVQRRQLQDPNTLVIDVRDAPDILLTGRIPGAVNISYGSLTFKADQGVPPAWRDPRLQDRSRPIITVCYSGELGALGAKLLQDMGFTNVAFVEGGTVAWKAAGLPTESRTFTQMVTEAMAAVPALKPAEVQRRQQQDTNTLVIDVRDAADIALTGIIPGAVNISYGSLTFKADQGVPPAWRDPRLQDRSRPIITVCYSGELGALGAKLLQDMGFTNVAFVEGGTQGWKDAGLPTEAP